MDSIPASSPTTAYTGQERSEVKMTAKHFDTRLSAAGLLTCLLVLLAGCGTDPENPQLTGTWTGQVQFTVPGGPTVPASITLSLTENDAGAVTGTMTYEVLGQSGSGPVTGSHKYPDVSLSLSITLAGEPLTGMYTGKVTAADRMEGTFTTDDGSFSGPLVLTRQAS